MGKKLESNMENKVKRTSVLNLIGDDSKVEVTRKFVGDESLGEIHSSIFENRIDNMVYKYYHTTRAKTVTSHTTQSEGNELL